MNTTPRFFATLLCTAATVTFAACTPSERRASKPSVDSTEYADDTRAWRVKRLDAIAGPDGWSALAGLFWMDSSVARIGRDPSNTFVLTSSTAPRTLGTLIRTDTTITFVADKKVAVVNDSVRIDSIVVHSDKHAHPTVLQHGSITLRLIERGGRLGIRVKDSLYNTRTEFAGLTYFTLDTALRVHARLIPHASPRTLRIANVIGQTEEYRSPGTLEFTVAGQLQRLTAAFEGSDTTQLFVIFRDATAKDSTYPAGRFLYATPADSSGYTVLDFNRAYNPPCAFTIFATCPLPPAENMLTIAIRAGEKRYSGAHGGSAPSIIATRQTASPTRASP
jgi:uncharacterized protein